MTIYRVSTDSSRRIAAHAVMQAPEGHSVTIKPWSRSLDQNAAQWPILDCFAKQLQWPVNGKMTALTTEEWKDVLTAGFRKESARLAMGCDGGVIMLGSRTSKFSAKEFSEWLVFLNYVAADRGVVITGDKVAA